MVRATCDRVGTQCRKFNDFVRGELRRRNLGQDALAEYLNITQACISRKLIGAQEWSLIQALNTADFFDVDVSEMIK